MLFLILLQQNCFRSHFSHFFRCLDINFACQSRLLPRLCAFLTQKGLLQADQSATSATCHTCNIPSLITVYNYILVCGSSGVWHVSRQEWNCQKNCTLLLIIFGNMRHECMVVSSCANAYCNRPLINVFVAERVTKIKIQQLTSGAHAQ